jgi:hypothetical protein
LRCLAHHQGVMRPTHGAPPSALIPQFERPDSAQSCSRVMPPKTRVSTNAPKSKPTMMSSPMTAARRDSGSCGRFWSSGSQWSGFLILSLSYNT